MARKRRAPSPPPPPPPQQAESSEESGTGEEEEEEDSPVAPAAQKPSDNGGAAASVEGQEDDSDTDTYAEAFQLRKVVHSPGDEEGEEGEEGGSSESEPEKPEPVRKETGKKSKAEAKKKRSVPEPASSGKNKKAKAAVENTAPEPAPSGKSKKAAKAAPEPAPSGKAKKSREAPVRVEPEKAPDSPPSSKSGKSLTRWTTADEIKILEFLTKHVKSHGTHPKPDEIIAALGDSLDRKNNSRSDIYEKVRRLRQRYEITAKKVAESGTLPVKDDDHRMYKLSLEIWGKDAKEAASGSTAQNDGTPSKRKKGQAKKDKINGVSKEVTTAANENGVILAEKKRGKGTKQKETVETKIESSKEATAIATPAKSKKKRNHKDKLDGEAKTGTSKETSTIATHDDSTPVGSKRVKANTEKLDGDTENAMQKEATTVTQNGGILTKIKGEETHKEEIGTDATMTGIRREFIELESLYPNLASFVKRIEAQHPCGRTFKRAFEFISNDKACTLESKIKKQKVAEVKMQLRRADTKKDVTNVLLGLLD